MAPWIYDSMTHSLAPLLHHSIAPLLHVTESLASTVSSLAPRITSFMWRFRIFLRLNKFKKENKKIH